MRKTIFAWWRHQKETFSALLAFCAGNSPVTGELPHKGQWGATLMFFLSRRWYETPSLPLWRHRNEQRLEAWSTMKQHPVWGQRFVYSNMAKHAHTHTHIYTTTALIRLDRAIHHNEVTWASLRGGDLSLQEKPIGANNAESVSLSSRYHEQYWWSMR